MLRNRICWLLLAAASAMLYVFHNQTGTRVLLAVSLLLPLCSALVLLPKAKLQAAISAPEAVSRAEAAACTLRIECGGAPVSFMGTLRVKNLLTGACDVIPIQNALITKKRPLLQPLSPSTAHCGALELTLAGCYAVCPLSLFRKKLKLHAEQTVFVQPKTHPLSVALADTPDFLQDSQRYDAKTPGYDPSETFRIRAYEPGDPLRQIHWKLTEKTDRLLVRDFGLPVVERLLVLVEMGRLPGSRTVPEDTDCLLDLLACLCRTLTAQQCGFRLGWQRAEGTYEERLIGSVLDASAALNALLQTPLAESERSVVGCYLSEHLRCAHASVAVLSTFAPPELQQLLRGNRVTLLLPKERIGTSGLWEDGAFVQPVDETTARLEL